MKNEQTYCYNLNMITENFRSNVRVHLNILQLPQSKAPTLVDIYKQTIKLLFKAKEGVEAIGVFNSCDFLTSRYEKVIEAMNHPRWIVVSCSYYMPGLVAKNAKTRKDLIYITNYLNNKDQCLKYENNNLVINDLVKKEEVTYDVQFKDEHYYIFPNGYFKSVRKKDRCLSQAIARYCFAISKKHYFIMIERLSEKSIDEYSIALLMEKEVKRTRAMTALTIGMMTNLRRF